MDKQHVDLKVMELQNKVSEHREELGNLIQSCIHISDELKNKLVNIVHEPQWSFEDYYSLYLECQMDSLVYYLKKDVSLLSAKDIEELKAFESQARKHINFIWIYYDSGEGRILYRKYLDSKKAQFEGDILITDPCYILRKNSVNSSRDDWKSCNYGQNMEALGIHNFITHDTIYGDWSCTTFNLDTEEVIGEFCADTGLVGVFSLDEVMKYNPKFDYHITKPWTTTWIKNFKGTAQIVVNHNGCEDYECIVVGKGIDMETREPLNFIGKQTGI